MVRKNAVYSAMTFGWAILVFGATVLVFSGNAEPFVSPSMLPAGPLGLFAFAGGLFVVGALVTSRLKRRAWKRAGREANLQPESGGLLGTPDLVGTVQGRPVRVRTEKRKEGDGGESGSSSVTYTMVEAELSGPATEGLIVSSADEDAGSEIAGIEMAQLETAAVGDFAVLGGSRAFAEDVLTTRVQNAVRDAHRLDSVLVGNSAEVLLTAVPDSDGMLMGYVTDKIEEKVRDRMAADTVATETKGMVLDGAELRRKAEAVAATADAFEDATAGHAGRAGG